MNEGARPQSALYASNILKSFLHFIGSQWWDARIGAMRGLWLVFGKQRFALDADGTGQEHCSSQDVKKEKKEKIAVWINNSGSLVDRIDLIFAMSRS